jgi:hypothetical protein
MRTPELLERFRALVEREQGERYGRKYGGCEPPRVTVKVGKRWVKVDVGTSGKYMVDADGTIYGIKAYGVPHYGYRYGTLETVEGWDWSGYGAISKGWRLGLAASQAGGREDDVWQS